MSVFIAFSKFSKIPFFPNLTFNNNVEFNIFWIFLKSNKIQTNCIENWKIMSGKRNRIAILWKMKKLEKTKMQKVFLFFPKRKKWWVSNCYFIYLHFFFVNHKIRSNSQSEMGKYVFKILFYQLSGHKQVLGVKAMKAKYFATSKNYCSISKFWFSPKYNQSFIYWIIIMVLCTDYGSMA